MQEKTIKSVLNKKFEDWLESITDINVKQLVKRNTIITGGAIVSLMNNEPPKDYDVYFRDKETVLAVANYYTNIFNTKHPDKIKIRVVDADHLGSEDTHWSLTNLEKGRIKLFIGSGKRIGGGYASEEDDWVKNPTEDIIEVMDKCDNIDVNHIDLNKDKDKITEIKDKYRPVFFSPNAITLSEKVQIVVRFYGEPSDIHSTYDFLHCTGYWTSWDKQLNITKEVYEAVMNKTLIYKGSKYPVCSLFRIRKFIERGWKINAGQILKIALQVSKLHLLDIHVLEDQLIGVDSSFFSQLIEQLHGKQENDPEWKFESGYLVSIIDKIF